MSEIREVMIEFEDSLWEMAEEIIRLRKLNQHLIDHGKLLLDCESAHLDRIARIQAVLAEAREAVCFWSPDQGYDYTAYDSQCGQSWVFEEDGPAENDMRFCPFCGKRLVVELPDEEGEG